MLLRNRLALFGLVLVLSPAAYGYESVYFDDGGYHIIDYILDAMVFVDRYSPGVGTQLELVEGGGIAPAEGYGSIYAFNDSQVTVSGGEMGWTLGARDRSRVELTGGYLGCEFFSRSSNTAYMSGGSVWAVVACCGGSFDVSGGTVRWGLETQDNTQAVITGGNIARLNCLDSSRMYISGGTIPGHINAGYYNDANSLITFYGSDFAINGQPVAIGEYASSYCSYSGQITGVLADGSTLNTSFELNGNADILFLPEPETPALIVNVDIKPGSCPNPVNVKSSGVLPVAILGTEDVNVIDIVIASIRLADPNVAPIRNSYEDVAAPVFDANDCNCTTDGPDGFLDLTLKFETQRIVEAIGDVNHDDILTLMLTGVLFDETPIEGVDCVLIRGKHKSLNKADINKDGVVDTVDFAIFAQNWLQSSIVED